MSQHDVPGLGGGQPGCELHGQAGVAVPRRGGGTHRHGLVPGEIWSKYFGKNGKEHRTENCKLFTFTPDPLL